ncbi:MAG: F0F1 ATP synthase subunit A [Weeksellaceae bacterium]|nr:F0F1 ATP synthase subunit A [Weeksellaceae bacterium]
MKVVASRLLVFLFLMFTFSASIAQNTEAETAEKGVTKEEVDEVIEHHMADDYYYTFLSNKETGAHYGFPLPVILIDNGLKIFSASEFDYGENVVNKGGQYYKLYHSKIYKTDAQGTIQYKENGFPANERPLDFSITKNVVNILIVGVIMFLLFTGMAKSYRRSVVPKGLTGILEPIVLYVKDEIAIPNIGEKHYKRFMPYLLTIFFFIWIVNMLGMTPLGMNVTGNIAVTFALAIITFVITQVVGTKTYWSHIFDPLGSSMPWIAKIPLYILLVPIEILGIFIKPFSLMIRLFANMSAGHIVMMSLLGMIFIFKSWIGGPLTFGLTVFIMIIEFFVALLQAYVFTILSALYFGFAVEEHEHEEAH